MNVDDQGALLNHYQIIRGKIFLKKIYIDFYKQFKEAKVPKGPIVEIGSGAGFIKEIIPRAITSDVIKGPGIEKVFFADKMPFKSNSVAAFFMIDVLHHIKDSEKALKEIFRCLKPHGKLVMIEPYNSILSGIIYKYFHPERFDPKAGWKVEGSGRMSDSNTALPWIIFVRDRKIFEKKFPQFLINKIEPHTPLRYLISGGLTSIQFLPSSLYNQVIYLEKLLTPLNKYISMFTTVELEKLTSRT